MTSLPAALETGVMQERTALPLRCTVHAPHWARPHPNLVPGRSRTSRSTHNKGISGATSTEVGFPLTFSWIGMHLILVGNSQLMSPIHKPVRLCL